tara:strand:- start:477 stop:740 length:264 start_codon:yes stop_codon:yes gene_type:complete
MAYTENSVWRNSTTSFTTADEAIADMRSYLVSSYSDQAKPAAENITFDSGTQTLSYSRTWDTEELKNSFETWLVANQPELGDWTQIE